MEITKLHPRAEWLLRGANQHFLLSHNGTHVPRASTSLQINTRIIALSLGTTMRVVPIHTNQQEVPTLAITDE